MAKPPARRSPRWNPPLIGKDKLAGLAPTEGSDTYTFIPAVSRAVTPAPPSAPALILTLTVDSMVRYPKTDLQ